MRWEDLESSDNVEDRRSEGGYAGGGGGFGMPIGGGGLGLGTMVVIGIIGWAVFGINPLVLLSMLSGGGGYQPYQQSRPYQPNMEARRTGTPSDEIGGFVSRVLGSTEAVWKDVFSKAGQTYRPPILVLYRGATDARCGGEARSAMGPFYCPVDQKVYLDTSFFQEIENRFHGCQGQACRFSQAYVIAHEVGHHVQDLQGTLDEAHNAQARSTETQGNAIQVGVELQADCYAGVWAANARDAQGNILEPGDVEEGMRAAEAIGDDMLQKQSQGVVVPESFTHGSSAQRMNALQTGLKTGDPAACKFNR